MVPLKDPLPNRKRWDPSGYHPFKSHDGNGLRHPFNMCVTCSERQSSTLHSRHEPQLGRWE